MLEINEILNALVIQISHGNVRAAEDFYRLSYRDLYRIAIGRMNNKDLAEEAVARIFAELPAICRRYVSTVNPWKSILGEQKRICRIILNNNKRKGIVLEFDNGCSYVTDVDSPIIIFMHAELNETERDIVIYRLYFGYGYKHIAELKGMNIRSVYKHYVNALKKVENFYREYKK